ncbi:unnamed protein product [Prorocentrum cordatum]|uniref:Uncharacterized protein n=1 Tax=Prorocentrum cordatum TaxID=2364126 RepID=A0ABN9YFN3_9DINO|nr:unnamed protein product [Polarella glacialis]
MVRADCLALGGGGPGLALPARGGPAADELLPAASGQLLPEGSPLVAPLGDTPYGAAYLVAIRPPAGKASALMDGADPPGGGFLALPGPRRAPWAPVAPEPQSGAWSHARQPAVWSSSRSMSRAYTISGEGAEKEIHEVRTRCDGERCVTAARHVLPAGRHGAEPAAGGWDFLGPRAGGHRPPNRPQPSPTAPICPLYSGSSRDGFSKFRRESLCS